ncbi:MAG: hypothetical protein ABWZ98_18025 [Nakamurella sp.]
MNRIQARLADRHRVVFSSPPVAVWLAEPEPIFAASLRHRMVRVLRQQTFSPLGATIAKPVGDAVATFQFLRIL